MDSSEIIKEQRARIQELLTEIEALKTQRQAIAPNTDSDGRGFLCGSCGKRIGKSARFCPSCGREVKR